MEDSYVIENFYALCRLCLNKSSLMVSIFGAAPDDEANITISSKISHCLELQMDPNDGLPSSICYKCLFKIDKCTSFRLQCIQNESKLRQIVNHVNELDNSNSSDLSIYNFSNSEDLQKPKSDSYVVEDSVVMVVDPSLDYDSSEESENIERVGQEVLERDNTPEGEQSTESFLKNVFMCQFCDQAFVSEERCKDHEQACHDPNLPFKCMECSLVFAERNQFVQHTKQIHGNDKPYHCPECDKCFGRRSDLRKHSIVHTGVRPYQCQYCLKSFSRNTNLSKHLRIHSGVKPHVCPLCPRSFVAKGDLQRHVLVHSGMKPYVCQKCPLAFGRRDKLLKHESKHDSNCSKQKKIHQEVNDMIVNVNPFNNLMTTPPETNSDYDLPRIPEHISSENSLLNQIPKNLPSPGKSPPKPKQSNKNKPKNIKCHQCVKRFSSLDAYKTHVSLTHIGCRTFQCKICFKKFLRKRDLDKHATLHNGIGPFSCNQCDKKFITKDKLDKHEQSNECLVVNLPCIECGITFEKKTELVSHIKSHFNELDNKNDADEIKKEEEPHFTLDETFYELET